MTDDHVPAEKVTVSRQALEDAVTQADSLARLLDDQGQPHLAETLRRWISGPLSAELAMATDDPTGPGD